LRGCAGRGRLHGKRGYPHASEAIPAFPDLLASATAPVARRRQPSRPMSAPGARETSGESIHRLVAITAIWSWIPRRLEFSRLVTNITSFARQPRYPRLSGSDVPLSASGLPGRLQLGCPNLAPPALPWSGGASVSLRSPGRCKTGELMKIFIGLPASPTARPQRSEDGRADGCLQPAPEGHYAGPFVGSPV
jgi:hypothetical protein